MIDLILLLPFTVSFLITLFLLPKWIIRAREEGLIGKDMNKNYELEVVESGGITVVLGFLIGILLYIALKTFYFKTSANLIEAFALITTVLIIAGIGLTDTILGWKRGLSKRLRIMLVIFSAVPLMVINAGENIVSLPFIGMVDFGMIYLFIIIPIGIAGAATTFNFLAGLNGLEAGQGIILLSALTIVSYFTGNSWLSVILLCMIASLLAFLLYNFYPAKVFPGDVMTYSVGGLIAIVAILGNFERIAVFFFIPYILELVLKSRGKLIKQSFGKPTKSGELDLPYDKLYSLTHVSMLALKKMNIRSTERNSTLLIWAFQVAIIIIGFILFRKGIFLI